MQGKRVVWIREADAQRTSRIQDTCKACESIVPLMTSDGEGFAAPWKVDEGEDVSFRIGLSLPAGRMVITASVLVSNPPVFFNSNAPCHQLALCHTALYTSGSKQKTKYGDCSLGRTIGHCVHLTFTVDHPSLSPYQ